MGRIKGTKLTKEQKERMAEGRLKKAKKIESIAKTPIIKRNKNEILIVAYGWNKDDDHVMPIFSSEINSFKGRMFKTLEKATKKFNEERR